MKKTTLLFLFLSFSIFLAAQRTPRLIINEFSLGASASFIELVVIGDLTNPQANNDFSGWVIDNNSIRLPNDQGLIKLGNCLNQLSPGTIVLIYDHHNIPFGIDPLNDGAPNVNGVYQLPFDHACLIRCDKNNSSCMVSNPSITNWKQAININKEADVIQIKTASGQLELALNWADMEFDDAFDEQTIPISPTYSPLNINMALLGSGGNGNLDCNKVVITPDPIGGLGTPGNFNDPGNGGMINGIRSGDQPRPLSLSCQAVDATADALGQIDLIIEGGETDYEITWSPALPNASISTNAENVSIPNLARGDYSITLTDARGCSRTCSANVEFPYKKYVCKGACDTIGVDDEGYCYVWESDGEENLPSTAEIEVCPEETTEYLLKVINNGKVLYTRKYVIEVNPLEPVIQPPNPFLCEDGEVNIYAYPNDNSNTYDWSTGSDQQTITVYDLGLYSVTVTTEDGCSGIAEIVIEE